MNFLILLMVSLFFDIYSNIPHVSEKMLTSDFWIQKTSNISTPLLSKKEIDTFNQNVYNKGYLVHPSIEPKRKYGKSIQVYISNDIKWFSQYKKYDINNNFISEQEFHKILEKKINFKNIPSVLTTKTCLVTSPTYLRAFPLDNEIMKKSNDYPFDILQKSFLDLGQEVVLFLLSTDTNWGYVQTSFTTGWVKIEAIAKNMTNFLTSNFVLAKKPAVKIFNDTNFLYPSNVFHMGNKLPLKHINKNTIEIYVPKRNKYGNLYFQSGFVRLSDITTNYLLLTRENIARQAFEMLGEPYSWGGKNFNTDCSSFLMSIFLTMGLELPRSSYLQIKMFKQQEKTYSSLTPFTTLLYHPNPGHIMLYLGENQGKHYIIHNKWMIKQKNKKIVIGQIIVSTIDLDSLWYQINQIGKF